MVSHKSNVRARIANLSQRHKFFLIATLLAINTGIGQYLMHEVVATTNAAMVPMVLDAQESLPDVHEIDTTEPLMQVQDDKQVITTYVVTAGDTLSSIASKFNVSTATVLWANNLTTKSKIGIGQKLTILPVTGIQYKVKKGDTVSGIAAKFDANSDEIIAVNDFEDGNDLRSGTMIIIPDAEPIAPAKTTPKKSVPSVTHKESSKRDTDDESPTSVGTGFYTNPIPGSVFTQGRHGNNGVDFGAPIGTTVYAAASGTVIVSKSGGYNGGYGTYIVIEHTNGTQTLYAHLSQTLVAVGDSVSQNERIAKSGNTGKSTGPHLHFEVRGATNPFTKYKKGTHF